MDNSSSPSDPMFDAKFWMMWTIIIILLILGNVKKCQAATNEAHYDTIPARVECIVKYVEKTHISAKSNKTVKHYVVYTDSKLGITDMIPISQAVYDYIQECVEFNVPPQLGIKLKNREIYSIVRIRKKIKHGY